MATFIPAHWACDTCDKKYGYYQHEMIWNCPGCGLEVCENCFFSFGHCLDCAVGKSEDFLIKQANEKGFCFDDS